MLLAEASLPSHEATRLKLQVLAVPGVAPAPVVSAGKTHSFSVTRTARVKSICVEFANCIIEHKIVESAHFNPNNYKLN